MNEASKHHRQHRREWTVVLLALFALATLLGWDLYRDFQAIDQAGRDRLLHNMHIADVTLSRRLQTTSNALQGIRSEVQAGKIARKDLNERLAIMVSAQTGVRSILLVDRDGHVTASSRRELLGLNFRGSERYKAIRDSADPHQLHLSPPFFTPLGSYAISLGLMIDDKQGKFDGYVLAVLDPDFFKILLESLVFSADVHASLIHFDGMMVFRVPDAENVAGTNLRERPGSLFVKFMNSGKKVDILTGIATATNVERMIAFAVISPAKAKIDKSLVIAIDRDISVMYAPWVGEMQLRVSLFAAIVFVSVFGLFFYQRRHRAIELLEEAQEAEREATEKKILQINAELEEKVRLRTAELEKANAELRHLSRHDILTGVANRMAANEHLHSEHVRMKRTGSTYSVLMIDVDYFKRINDTYGHETGDVVLKRVAKTLNSCVRASDFLARFGGEEFLLLLPDTNVESALLVAEKIRQAVESSPDPIAGKVTISIGLASADTGDLDESAGVSRADSQLYEAKSAGRNRVSAAKN